LLVGGVVVAVGGRGRGGAARRLAGFLAGVRGTKIEARRYKVGWMRLNAGRSKRGGGSVCGRDPYGVPRVGGELGRGGRRRRRRRRPPLRFGRGGLSSRPLSIVTDPWTVMAQMVGIRSGRVIGVIST